MLGEKQLGAPCVTAVSWLSAPLKAVGLWPYCFLPSSCGWKLLPPALTKAPLTLSPSDFPSRGFEELGCAGGGKGGTGHINSFLPVQDWPADPFLDQEGSLLFPRASVGWTLIWEEVQKLITAMQWKSPATSCREWDEDQ